jgi:hypothetical protein
MNSPRVITSDKLIQILTQPTIGGSPPYLTWEKELDPNGVNVIDHAVTLRGCVKCRILCVHRNSYEMHEHQIEMTRAQFDALPTADEFARQLERINDEN